LTFRLQRIPPLPATLKVFIRNQTMGVTMSRKAINRGNKKPKTTKQNRRAKSRKKATFAEGSAPGSKKAEKAPCHWGKKPQSRKPDGGKAKPGGPDVSVAAASEMQVAGADPVHAAARLRKSIKEKVSMQFNDIAQALINTAKKGNMTGARLIVELTGANKPSADERQDDVARLKIPDPELLAAEPEWKDPEVGDIWVGDHWESPSQPPNSDTEPSPDH
jgi:hypothetical protein